MKDPRGAAIDLEPLAWARAAVGALLLLRTTPLLAPLDLWFLRDTLPLLGWPQAGWSATPGLLALPAGVVEALCVLRTLGAVALMLGVFARAGGIVAGIAGYLVMAHDPFGLVFTLHLLYQAAILLALTDAGSTFALRPAAVRSAASGVTLMRLWIASIYFWAGIAKLRPDWLDGRTLELFWHGGAIHGALADMVVGTPVRRALFGTGTALWETALGPLLLWPRTRRFALLGAYLFHAGLELTARPDLLGWAMASLLLCFVDRARSSPVSAC